MKARKEREIARPALMERLRRALGNYQRLSVALGVPDNYPIKWRRCGYIPERWALDIHRLGVRDEWGLITGMTVLYEAEDRRLQMVREQSGD